ncbi:MAG: hypothetical protein GY807_10695, partial [Gammaproteobacteria bacterium]|nr:hypothetical protein [Gammaproteobacteria bacterium]
YDGSQLATLNQAVIAFGEIGLELLDRGSDTDVTIANTQFISNSLRAVYLDLDNAAGQVTLQNNSASGNSVNGVGVGGTISQTLHFDWSAESNLPLVLLDNLTVRDMGNLSLSPGTIIKGWQNVYNDPLDINVYGALSATGTISQPVVFTSLADDTYGGDTNNDGNATFPSPGDWGRIRFYDGSQLATLNQAVIAFGEIGLELLGLET